MKSIHQYSQNIDHAYFNQRSSKTPSRQPLKTKLQQPTVSNYEFQYTKQTGYSNINPSRSKSSLQNNRSNIAISQPYLNENNEKVIYKMKQYNGTYMQNKQQVLQERSKKNFIYHQDRLKDNVQKDRSKGKSINKNVKFQKPSLTINFGQKQNQNTAKHIGQIQNSSNLKFQVSKYNQIPQKQKSYERYTAKMHAHKQINQEYNDEDAQQEYNEPFTINQSDLYKHTPFNTSNTNGSTKKNHTKSKNIQGQFANYENFVEKRFQIDVTSRKQNAYKQAMLSSMNNIECINNKINDLLSIVKQNKYKQAINRTQQSPPYTNTPKRMGKQYSQLYINHDDSPSEMKIQRKLSTKVVSYGRNDDRIGKIYQRQQRSLDKQDQQQKYYKSPQIKRNRENLSPIQRSSNKQPLNKEYRYRVGQISSKKDKKDRSNHKNIDYQNLYPLHKKINEENNKFQESKKKNEYLKNQKQKQMRRDDLKFSDKERDQNIEQILKKYSKDRQRKAKVEQISQITSSHLTKVSNQEIIQREFAQNQLQDRTARTKIHIIDHQIQKIKQLKQISEENNKSNLKKLKSYKKIQNNDYYQTGKFKYVQDDDETEQHTSQISKISKKEDIQQQAKNIMQKYSFKRNNSKKEIQGQNNIKKNEISMIKKKYQNSKQKEVNQLSSKGQKIKLAKKLSNQIKLDLNMKQARHQFEKISEQNEKWSFLAEKLEDSNIFLRKEDVQFLVKLSPDQFYPFEEPAQAQSEYSIKRDLADYLIEAQNYWQHEICQGINFQSLLMQGFSLSQLDVNKKGYIKPEDLVCFINLYCQTYYVNRDIAIIFKRFQLLQQEANDFITFQTIQKAFIN